MAAAPYLAIDNPTKQLPYLTAVNGQATAAPVAKTAPIAGATPGDIVAAQPVAKTAPISGTMASQPGIDPSRVWNGDTSLLDPNAPPIIRVSDISYGKNPYYTGIGGGVDQYGNKQWMAPEYSWTNKLSDANQGAWGPSNNINFVPNADNTGFGLQIKSGQQAGVTTQYKLDPTGQYWVPQGAGTTGFMAGGTPYGHDYWIPAAFIAAGATAGASLGAAGGAGAGGFVTPGAASGVGGTTGAGTFAGETVAGAAAAGSAPEYIGAGSSPAAGAGAGTAAESAAPAAGSGFLDSAEGGAMGTAAQGTGNSAAGTAAQTGAGTSSSSSLYKDLLTKVGLPLAQAAIGSSGNSSANSAGARDTAVTNQALQQELAGVGREQLQRAKEWDAKYAPIYDQIMQGFLQDQQTGRDRSAQAWDTWANTYLPVAKKSADDAMNWDSAANVEARAGRAGATVDTAFDRASEQKARDLARAGVTSSSGRSAANDVYARAAAKASAINNERTNTQTQAIQLRRDQAALGPAQQAVAGQQQAAAGAAGQGAASTIASGTAASNLNRNNAAQFMGQAVGAGNSAAAILQEQALRDYMNNADRNAMWGNIAGAIGNWASNYNWGG